MVLRFCFGPLHLRLFINRQVRAASGGKTDFSFFLGHTVKPQRRSKFHNFCLTSAAVLLVLFLLFRTFFVVARNAIGNVRTATPECSKIKCPGVEISVSGKGVEMSSWCRSRCPEVGLGIVVVDDRGVQRSV